MADLWVDKKDEMEEKAKHVCIKVAEFTKLCHDKDQIAEMRNLLASKEGISVPSPKKIEKRRPEGQESEGQHRAEAEGHPEAKAKSKAKASTEPKQKKTRIQAKAKSKAKASTEPQTDPKAESKAKAESQMGGAAADMLQRWALPSSDSGSETSE